MKEKFIHKESYRIVEKFVMGFKKKRARIIKKCSITAHGRRLPLINTSTYVPANRSTLKVR